MYLNLQGEGGCLTHWPEAETGIRPMATGFPLTRCLGLLPGTGQAWGRSSASLTAGSAPLALCP